MFITQNKKIKNPVIMETWLEALHTLREILLASSWPLTAQGYGEIHCLFNTYSNLMLE